MKAKRSTIKPIASFNEIAEIGINMPGCKCLLHYVDSKGNSTEIPLEEVRTITLKSGGSERADKRAIKTKRGKISVK